MSPLESHSLAGEALRARSRLGDLEATGLRLLLRAGLLLLLLLRTGLLLTLLLLLLLRAGLLLLLLLLLRAGLLLTLLLLLLLLLRTGLLLIEGLLPRRGGLRLGDTLGGVLALLRVRLRTRSRLSSLGLRRRSLRRSMLTLRERRWPLLRLRCRDA